MSTIEMLPVIVVRAILGASMVSCAIEFARQKEGLSWSQKKAGVAIIAIIASMAYAMWVDYLGTTVFVIGLGLLLILLWPLYRLIWFKR
ncbi:hypothetical protein [Gloeobacter kilaueensis]|uniref:Uncharacterized protein n=1 Tax=Gloeobacter kilaueensis (strain ATCC BAA-2537 / CCAP 1431/1 / ULC 316 / JS1) TaxID=1183438 RepID=U5QET7_GLOK1|nr:hypothetical protein [Gloeobacter kilaueensis]AGY57426.1 hypothetical protein GKIL_1180 [Gloeobacter kilaueensis JS1]